MSKFKIYYKYFFGLLSFCTILSYYIWNIADGREVKRVYQGNYEIYTIDYLTTFTLLSNVLVQAWFFCAAINYKQEGKSKLLGHTSANALATMITVTLIIYNGILIPVNGFPNESFGQFVTIVDHVIMPIAFIVYVNVLMDNKQHISLKDFLKNKFWIQFTMVLTYCIFAMIRGELRFNSGEYYYQLGQNGKPIINLLYPYFFLDIHHTGPANIPGIGWFFIAFFSIIGLLVVFSSLYNWINSKVIEKEFYKTKH